MKLSFIFQSDPLSEDHMIGYLPQYDKPYWVGGCDIPDGCEFKTANSIDIRGTKEGMKIRDLDLSVIVKAGLRRAGYEDVEELRDLADEKLLEIRNMNKESIRIIRKTLKEISSLKEENESSVNDNSSPDVNLDLAVQKAGEKNSAAIAEEDIKENELRILVQRGILTEDECQKCISVINDLKDSSKNIPSEPTAPKRIRKVVFEDNRIKLTYKGIGKNTNLLFGDGIRIIFTIKNKTSHDISVSANDIMINEIVVETSCYIAAKVPANKSIVDYVFLYYSKLNDCDVYCIGDIVNVTFDLKYSLTDLDHEYEASEVTLDPYDVS